MVRFAIQPPTAARACRVLIGRGERFAIDDLVYKTGPYDSIHVVFDEKLARHAEELRARLADADLISQPGGETQKTLAVVEQLALRLIAARASRQSLLIVLGGGSLCDLGAFVAATILRGIECVLVPSTLLAMIDAAIGGKNGVDLAGQKNAIGTIRQPTAVVVDPELLAGLPEDRFREGLVEAIKIAAIRDAKLFAELEQKLDAILQRDTSAVDRLIERAIRLKGEVVTADERDSGQRLLLNFGHTVGHAIESWSGFQVSHGAAVARGMAIELRLARASCAARIEALLARLEITATAIPNDLPATALWDAMLKDKKRAAGRVRIAAPDEIGCGRVIDITRADLERALAP
ncbi:MAG: 3-dehydroquinate synthase family protein [Planctomycetota bacterium]